MAVSTKSFVPTQAHIPLIGIELTKCIQTLDQKTSEGSQKSWLKQAQTGNSDHPQYIQGIQSEAPFTAVMHSYSW